MKKSANNTKINKKTLDKLARKEKKLTEILSIRLTENIPSLEIFNIRNALIGYGIAKDNKYLYKYLDLIANNLNTEKILYTTQKHHCIPVYIYKKILKKYKLTLRNDLIDFGAELDLNNKVVNLIYKDHVKAHIYLALCCKSRKALIKNIMVPIKRRYRLFTKIYLKKLLLNEDYFNQLQLDYENSKKIAGQKISQTRQAHKTGYIEEEVK